MVLLLLQEIHVVDVHLLQLAEVSFEVRDVFKHVLQHVIYRLRRLVLQRGAFAAQYLGVLLVLIHLLREILYVLLIRLFNK